MAIQEIHTFPQFDHFDITMELGPTKLTLRYTYRSRTKSWYLDIFSLNGTPLVLGRRLSPYWSPIFGYALMPELIEGVLFVRGPDDYAQADLGKTLILEYISEQDLLFFVPLPTEEPFTVTITASP